LLYCDNKAAVTFWIKEIGKGYKTLEGLDVGIN